MGKESRERKRVLITGVNGFVGSHLAELCLKNGWQTFGTIRHPRSPLKNLDGVPVKLLPCDLLDYQAVADAVRASNPDYVFHLAAQSFVPSSWTSPRATLDVNIVGTLHVLEAVRHEGLNAAVQIAGSSEEYGHVEEYECPIGEAQALRPLSPYGVSKAAADMLARQYAASHKMRVVVTRAFNHTGPRRGASFAESQWARHIALVEAGIEKGALEHGNLDAVRDYTHVKDIVRGYVAAVERGEAGAVYNLGSGVDQSPTMRQVLERLCREARTPIACIASPKHMRPSDVPRLVANANLAKSNLGWSPEYDLDEIMTDLLNYWRDEVARGQGSEAFSATRAR